MERYAHQPVLLVPKIDVAQRRATRTEPSAGLTRVTRNAVPFRHPQSIVGSPGHLPRITEIADDNARSGLPGPTVCSLRGFCARTPIAQRTASVSDAAARRSHARCACRRTAASAVS